MEINNSEHIQNLIRSSPNKFVNVIYVDMLGNLKNLSIPTTQVTSTSFTDGVNMYFSGINLDGNEKELIPVLDKNTFRSIQFEVPEQIIFVFFKEKDEHLSDFDSRAICKKAQDKFKAKDLDIFIGVSIEYSLFQSAPQDAFSAGVPANDDVVNNFIDQTNNLLLEAYKINLNGTRKKEAGQVESILSFDEPLNIADNITFFKNMIKRFSQMNNLFTTFIPQPLIGAKGNSLRLFIKLKKTKLDKFYDEEKGINQNARNFITGVYENLEQIMAFSNSTTNSYKKIMNEEKIKINIDDKKIFSYKVEEEIKQTTLIINIADSYSNPYLLIASILLAGYEGMKNKKEPKEKEKNIPLSLKDSLDKLAKNNKFLKPVFSEEFLEKYIEFKIAEYEFNEKTPTQYEFRQYI